MADLEQFRADARAWLEANCPPSMRSPMVESEIVWGGRNQTFANQDSKIWLDRMVAKGWTAPAWPKEYGGGGLSKAEAIVLDQEMKRLNARSPLASFGIWMLGPVLLEYASEEQKKKFLPDIVAGKTRWCQGYSEPGAGSDLAALQTKCVDRGDHWLINGSKIWTSYADQADWIFCLVRTDFTKKHEGVSFILFDMTTPGVETRPILLISGSSPFCETFFTDVKVPKDQLVGTPGKGWEIAKRLLQYERQNISATGFGADRNSGPTLADIAKKYVGMKDGVLADGDLRARITKSMIYEHAFKLTIQRNAEMAKAGADVGPGTSIIKYAAAKMNQTKTELQIEAMGHQGLGWEGEGFKPGEIMSTRAMLRAKGNSIEGGTSEVNLNVIAKRVLGLRDHQ
ncbi:MAG: acyl-CoA dehydrogenase family protein [Hyphomonadaceae bacterium]|jgi:alkylation response protein AidB-like acyl-CoA dehydrogenase|nr:acyl-CoA dehydrogenase family protein [Hyphomonadaceae bacterium]